MSTDKGRPAVYPSLLALIPDDHQWHPIRYGHKTNTAPSSLRIRYPGFDFKMQHEEDESYTVLARRLT